MTEAKRGRGRPKGAYKDAAAITRALELIASGECANAREASEHPDVKGRIGWRQIHEARKRAEEEAAAKPAGRPSRKPAPKATARLPSAPPPATTAAPPDEEPAPPPVVAERPPPGLGPKALRVWYIRKEIEAINEALAQARALGERGLSRIGTLTGHLRTWLDELAKVEPEPETKDDEEARWRAAAASAVAKIERGVREAEGAAACRKCGAACPMCAKA